MEDNTAETQIASPEKIEMTLSEVSVDGESKDKGTANGTGLNRESDNTPEEKAEASRMKSSPRFVFGVPWPSRFVFGVRWFVANLAALYFFQFAMIVYLFGVIRTMERRFGLDSRKSGVILSADDVVQICVVTFIGHFGKRVSKPRIIGILALSFAVGGMTLALPHFLYGAQTHSSGSARNFSYGMQPADRNKMYCDAANSGDECQASGKSTQMTYGLAYGLFILGQMFVGLGYSSTTVLGLSYIDENAPKNKSSLYIGVFSGIISIGAIFGHLLAAMCTQLPEDLFGETTLKQGDPTWIGCWWLGYVICSIIVTIFAISIFFFPKSLSKDSEDASQENGTEHPPDGTEHPQDEPGLIDQLKEFPKSFRSLLTNAPYMVRQLSNVLMVFFIIGVFANVPRYLEIHFHLPASLANSLAAVPSVASVLGAVAGGALMSRLRLSPPAAAKLLVGSTFVVLCGAGAALSMGCPQIDMAGTWNRAYDSMSMSTSCNANCSCSTQKSFYTPVCGSNSVSYFSPCHAGCEQGVNGTFSNCGCIADGSATSGFCSETCQLLVPYIGALLIIYLIGSISRVPSTIVMFRIVKKDERSFGLAFQSFCVNLLGFIPAPVFIGALIDSTCILWDESCGKRGACLLYDIASFRYLTYGVGFGVLVLVLACKVILWYLIRDMKFDDFDVEQVMPMEVNINDKPAGVPEVKFSAKADDIPADDVTVDGVPADDVTVDGVPAGDVAVDSVPAGDFTVDGVPAGDVTVDSVLAGDVTVDGGPAVEEKSGKTFETVDIS